MIELNNVTKKYGETTVLQDSSYVFPNTGLVCLLGESGCGKTTMMNLIAGLDSEYTGSILVDNVQLHTLSEQELCDYRKDYIGFVFQDYHLLHGYTVVENIVYPCVLKNMDQKNVLLQTEELLKDMNLSDKANTHVQNLSGGQKQRVAIARALIKDPKIILADEPTGSLDRKTSTEIMQILKDISKTKLVLVITHDHHICTYADEIITIEEQQVHIQKHTNATSKASSDTMQLTPPINVHTFLLGYKNFKVAWVKYFLVSCIFSLGIICILCSLSSGNIIDTSISDFKEKNVAFNNGFIKNEGNGKIFQKLKQDKRINNVYKQYTLEDISLSMKEHFETISEKYPTAKAKESLSYGTMPRKKKNEIVLTPSLAKKYDSKINQLIGKKLTLSYNNKDYTLTVSGIYNAGYDDFLVSSDVEKTLYQGVKEDAYYSISYDVLAFEDVVVISEELANANVTSENASGQVKNMQRTFSKIQNLFLLISGMISCVAIFTIVILLIKMQAVRYKIVGLLYSFGFHKRMVVKVMVAENMMLSLSISCLLSILFIAMQLVSQVYPIPIRMGIPEFVITLLLSNCFILLILVLINRKLINTSPTVALRK